MIIFSREAKFFLSLALRVPGESSTASWLALWETNRFFIQRSCVGRYTWMGARIFGAPSLEGPCHWGNNRNADLFWDIDVNPISVRLELEGFGMSVKDD